MATFASSATASSSDKPGWNFAFDASRRFAVLEDRERLDLLRKWGIAPGESSMHMQQYTYDNIVRREHAEDFLLAFVNSDAFRGNFMIGDGRGGLTYFTAPARLTQVKFDALTTTSTTLDLFDRLETCGGIVHEESHRIAGMMDVYLPGGVTVADQLRGLFMLQEESDHYDIYSPAEREEFLYHVMWRLVSGGAMNQWEDNFEVYKDTVRDFYRELVAVAKDPLSGEIGVQSLVFQIHGAKGADGEATFFTKDDGDHHNHNFLYVQVHPAWRTLTVWYNGFWSAF